MVVLVSDKCNSRARRASTDKHDAQIFLSFVNNFSSLQKSRIYASVSYNSY